MSKFNENYHDENESISITNMGEPDIAVTIGTPAVCTYKNLEPSKISIFAGAAKINSFKSSNNIATFDMPFDVTIENEDGSFSCYQIIKRIGVDKCKLANEALFDVPVSVVENKKINEVAASSSNIFQMRRLAGLA